MNLFKNAKLNPLKPVATGTTKRQCDNCQTEYQADNRNLARGWGKCCSKSCAASLREKSKPGYDPIRVKENNIRRILWNVKDHEDEEERDYHENYDPGDSEYWDNSSNGMFGD